MRGLDCGTSNFVAAKQSGGEISFSRERDAYYVAHPKTPIQASFIKKGLESNNSRFFETANGDIVVIGQGAIDYAVTRDDVVRRPMSKGVVVAKDKDSIPILNRIMYYVLNEPESENEVVVYSVPAPSVDVKFDVTYHTNTMADELRKLGFNPKPLNEAEALCYANLLDENLTGICFSFGAGCVNMCLMHSGESVVTFSTAKSGDYVDEMVGHAFDISPTIVQKEKESGMSILQPSNQVQTAIAGQYRVMIKYALENLRYDFDRAEKKAKVRAPVPVVVSGGTSMVGGFMEVFEASIKEVGFPFEVSSVRPSKNQLYDVAKGCLMAAEMMY